MRPRRLYAGSGLKPRDGHLGGHAGTLERATEGVLIDSIVWTLTQLEEVEAVQILVEGQIVETLAGHIAVNKPQSNGFSVKQPM